MLTWIPPRCMCNDHASKKQLSSKKALSLLLISTRPRPCASSWLLLYSPSWYPRTIRVRMASIVREAFGKAGLYEILNVKKTATAAEIKKAYFKLALQFVRLF